jgi:hypothetical protein
VRTNKNAVVSECSKELIVGGLRSIRMRCKERGHFNNLTERAQTSNVTLEKGTCSESRERLVTLAE